MYEFLLGAIAVFKNYAVNIGNLVLLYQIILLGIMNKQHITTW